MTPATRLSGHIVQGARRCDGGSPSLSIELGDKNWWLKVRVPAHLDRYLRKLVDRDWRIV